MQCKLVCGYIFPQMLDRYRFWDAICYRFILSATYFLSILLSTYVILVDRLPVGQIHGNRQSVSKFQVVIPKRVREELRPGQELNVLDGTIRFSKPRSIQELRGMCKGMKWKDLDRDHTERF